MLKGVDREVRVQLPVEPFEDVEVECCGDAFRVVKRAMDYRGVLSQIGTEEKPVDRRHQSGHVREQCDGRLPRKVSDRAAKEGNQRRIRKLRKSERLTDV